MGRRRTEVRTETAANWSAIAVFFRRPNVMRASPYVTLFALGRRQAKSSAKKIRRDDRAGEQLRKKREEERVVERIAHRGHALAVDVDEIRDGLKRVKTDADRSIEFTSEGS